MKIKFLLLPFTILAASVIIIALFAFTIIKKSQDCGQFVIDTYELASGIDIPKQETSSCIYFEQDQIRTALYQIRNIDEFILNYRLSIMEKKELDMLWSHDFLSEQQIQIPDLNHVFYRTNGVDSKHKWQCLLDKNTGQLWFEIQWL